MRKAAASEQQELTMNQECQGTIPKAAIMVVAQEGGVLSPAQVEFNKLMKNLEKARLQLEKQRLRLDGVSSYCQKELVPLLIHFNQLEFLVITHFAAALQNLKLTKRRQEALKSFVGRKLVVMLHDPFGLSEADIAHLNALSGEILGPTVKDNVEPLDQRSFDALKGKVIDAAHVAGVDLDLSDIEFQDDLDPAVLDALLRKRLADAFAQNWNTANHGESRPRKPTKAQLERQKKQEEAEEAKKRDMKSLYKQLAKVLHPDLEQDLGRKIQKEEWMKRLTTAHSEGDLRDLLFIEMEWLGVEESSNLASATDQKLRAYCDVLKQQIAETKLESAKLLYAPEYAVTWRFRDEFSGYLAPEAKLQANLMDRISRHEHLAKHLKAGGAAARDIIYRRIDEHAYELDECSF